MSRESHKIASIALDLEKLHDKGYSLLPEEYYFLYRIYKDGLFGNEYDWSKMMAFARQSADTGHPIMRDFFVNLYLHQPKRYVWGQIVPTERQVEQWLQESTTHTVHIDYLKRLYGKGTEKYNNALFQMAYDNLSVLDLARYYYDGIGCEQNTVLGNYWALSVNDGDGEAVGYQMLQEHAPKEARIPNGEYDIIDEELIREAAYETGDTLVQIDRICWEREEKSWQNSVEIPFTPEESNFLYECAENGIIAAKRIFFKTMVDEYCDNELDMSTSLLDILLRYAAELDRLDIGDIHYSTALLMDYYTGEDHISDMVMHLRRAALLIETPNEGGYYNRVRCLEVLQEYIRKGQLPVEGNTEIHIQFFEFLKRNIYELDLLNKYRD